MSSHGNLADPEYEPTDEELQELSRSAFAGVAEKNAATLRQVHARIAELRAENRQRLEAIKRGELSESAK